jgi:HEAT repeat protein
VDKIHPSTHQRVEETLLNILHSEDESLVRRRALEALGYSAREDVMPAIEQAYACGDPEWLISALNAMGNSADRKWKPQVMAMLDHQHPLVRAEAASAAGEIEVKSAVPALLRMLGDVDLDVRMAVIWALSQLGGKGVRKALEKMLEATDDDDEADMLERALENLDFTEDLSAIALLNITDTGEEDEELFADEELDELEDEGDSRA